MKSAKRAMSRRMLWTLYVLICLCCGAITTGIGVLAVTVLNGFEPSTLLIAVPMLFPIGVIGGKDVAEFVINFMDRDR